MRSTLQKQRQQMLRVNAAGERGAVRIYEGQYAALKHTADAPLIAHMLAQEKSHSECFDALCASESVARTRFTPLWDVAGYALGYLSAKIGGHRGAMACTVAVEEVIDRHYTTQLECLQHQPTAAPLRELIEACRADELEHHATALHEGAAQLRGYTPFTGAVRAATRLAIWLSKRV